MVQAMKVESRVLMRGNQMYGRRILLKCPRTNNEDPFMGGGGGGPTSTRV